MVQIFGCLEYEPARPFCRNSGNNKNEQSHLMRQSSHAYIQQKMKLKNGSFKNKTYTQIELINYINFYNNFTLSKSLLQTQKT